MKGIKYCWIALLLATSVSCVRETFLDAGETHIVVDGVLANDNVQSVRLFYTKTISQKEAAIIKDAVVSLTDLTIGENVGSYSRKEGTDVWTLTYYPVAGHSYRLEVEVPGRDLVYAEQEMPGPCLTMIDLIFSDYSSEAGLQYQEYGFRYAYRFDSFRNHCWICGLDYNAGTGERELAEQICTDYPYVDNFNLTGDLYTLHGLEMPTESQYPPLDLPVHRSFLRLPIPPEDVWGYDEAFIITGLFSGEYFGSQKELSDEMGVVEAMAVSDEYDRYLREYLILSEQKESSDLADIFIRDNMYSNIHGGIGIWGARHVTPLRWSMFGY